MVDDAEAEDDDALEQFNVVEYDAIYETCVIFILKLNLS